jgi:FixJ family two-component response regulator
MTATEFTIFLIDDDPAVLKSLDRLLRAAGYQTKPYLSAKLFLREHDASVPGCIVLDLNMPGLSGLDVQGALAGQDPDRPIVFLTGQGTISASVLAMRAGAIDFLSKPIDKSELLTAIKAAQKLDTTRRGAKGARQVILDRLKKLTAREREVLDFVIKGSLNKQTGSALGVHEKTVKVHRARALEKMGVKNVPELVRMMGAVVR